MHHRQNPGYAYAVNSSCFPFKICPVMESMHSISTDDALLVSTTSTMIVPVNKVKLWNQQHVLFCRLAIKETNFVFSFTVIFQSRRRHCKYDWLESVWIWLAASTQSPKYDWLRLDKIWLAAAAPGTINSAMHRSTRLEHGCTEFTEITQGNGHYAVQGHRFWYQSEAYIRLPISD